jgi:hypothetical protein
MHVAARLPSPKPAVAAKGRRKQMARMCKFLGEVWMHMKCRARQRRTRKDPAANPHHWAVVAQIFFHGNNSADFFAEFRRP